MSIEIEQINLQEQFLEIIATQDKILIKEFLDNQNISDVADLIYHNTNDEATIVANMAINRAAKVFKILDFATQKQIINKLPSNKTAELLNELPADDRTDFFEELPKTVIRDLIKLLDADERKITLSLLGYPEDSVGRLMTPDYVFVYTHNTIEEVLETIRKYAKNSETIDVIYIVNEQDELIDDIRIRDVILASPEKKMEELIDGRYVALHVNDDQEHASQIFKMNNRVALPVIDDNNKLLGIVTIDDMLWVANEEFSEDMQKMGGTEALNEPYLDISIFKLFRKRVLWLVILFLGELLTASVMFYFESEIAKAVFLATFIPLIISSGGNSGSQASTLIIQAMAVGEIKIADWWRVLRREILSGLMLGTVLGMIGFIRIMIWHEFFPNIYGDHFILVGFVIFFSLIGVVLWGTLSGSMLPLVLKKMGADPAVSSAPFVATLVDVTGLIIYFSFAYLFLQGLIL
ncbi:MAG TPA: magnesium transporter [Chitinophagaceae bacterium]|nr:magnesium transporter [Chitinophagaceae bacterium]MCC6635627.1 magnesium transporter [Chitinophagaceae bacterium]HMZ46665.1 magnesium transporter [Chitinophagaceae bacterium]HNE92616.1 magnesium transporter [Chitinophagaceae bacterium]HNM34646.1 magnesium transporter [Chitinophagaceae bacterium]